ncbi:hypothetical protein [Streptomyces albireticuli]|uniref:hypothetical protein n=1 Tax=Streptomyces albireticuli TaxID=1940 RepID=UPI003692FA03
MQEYILRAAYERATAVEVKVLEPFRASMARSADAFEAEPGACDPSPEQRAAEQQAWAGFGPRERGRAA